jgi:hypothetical protein
MDAQLDRSSRVARHLCEVSTLTSQIKDMSPVVMLRLRNMTAVDATGLRAMQEFADAVHASGRVVPGLNSIATWPPRISFRNVESALARAIELRRAIA